MHHGSAREHAMLCFVFTDMRRGEETVGLLPRRPVLSEDRTFLWHIYSEEKQQLFVQSRGHWDSLTARENSTTTAKET